jgi:hypothetical protein
MQAMFRQIQRGPTANDYKDSAELRSQSPKNGLIGRQSAGEDFPQNTAAAPLNRRVASSCARQPLEVD